MKNWVIILAVLIIPVAIFAYLDKNSASSTSAEAVSSQPVVYKFQSQMCSDCKKVEAEFKKLYPAYEGKIKFEQIQAQNTDKYTNDMIKKYKVTVVPTLIFTNSNGVVLKRTEGYQTKETIENILKELK